MAIETFEFIDDLNAANPTATDNVSEGDDHLRGLKTTLKNTFPNVTGAITATETELNYVDGVTSNIQTQLGTKLPLAGGTMTGDVSLGDNVNANFGAGSDLKIYHDGSDSYIDDVGTGDLYIRGSDDIRIQKYTGETMIHMDVDGGVFLNYDNALKLATTATGIDVTGEVKFTNWTVSESGGVLYFATGGTNKMKLDASGNLTCVGDVTAFGTV
jgi:hypothetical protein